MSAGRRNTKVDIEEFTGTVRDAAGFIDPTDANNWTNQGSRWAEVKPQRGREFNNAKQTQADLTHIISLVADTLTLSITTEWRLKISGTSRVLNVLSVHDIRERNREVLVYCKEAV